MSYWDDASYIRHDEEMDRLARCFQKPDEWLDGFQPTFCRDCGARLGMTLASSPGALLCQECTWKRAFAGAALPDRKAASEEDDIEARRRCA